jgi:hypothetical protein
MMGTTTKYSTTLFRRSSKPCSLRFSFYCLALPLLLVLLVGNAVGVLSVGNAVGVLLSENHHHAHGISEWKQYEEYKRITQTVIPTNSSFESELFSGWSTDVDGFMHFGYVDVNHMRERVRDKSQQLTQAYPSLLWNQSNLLDYNKHAPAASQRTNDCTYMASFQSLQIPSAMNAYRYELLLSVNQSNCLSGTSVRGGASFDVNSRFALFDADDSSYYRLKTSVITKCSVEDFFDDSYMVRCFFNVDHLSGPSAAEHSPANKTELESNLVCFNTSVVVDYEHFEAFSDFRKAGANSIRHRVPVARIVARGVDITIVNTKEEKYTYLIHELPADNLQNFVVCFAPKVSSDLRPHRRHLRSADSRKNLTPQRMHRKLFNPNTEGAAGLSRKRGQWVEHYPYSHFHSGLSAPLMEIFNLSYVFNLKRAEIAQMNPSDLFYCGGTSALAPAAEQYLTNLRRTILLSANNERGEIAGLRLDRHRPLSKWTGGNRLLSSKLVKSVSRYTQLIFLGESHMRYAWDYVVGLYFPESEATLKNLKQKHLDVDTLAEVSLKHRLFIPNIAKELLAIHHDTVRSSDFSNDRTVQQQQQVAVVVQFGTWDLDVYPARNLMDSPTRGVSKFVDSIRELILTRAGLMRDMKFNEATPPVNMKPLHVIFVDTFPHYSKNGPTGAAFAGGWRNNPVVAAVNQKVFRLLTEMLVTQLRSLQAEDDIPGAEYYSMTQLTTEFSFQRSAWLKITLIQAYNVLSSNSEYMVGVCGDHTLCRQDSDDGSGEKFSALQSGLVVLNTILRAAYGVNISAAEDDIVFDELDIVGVIDANQKLLHYLMLHGMLWKIPDTETVQYLVRNRLESCIRQTHSIARTDSISEGVTESLLNNVVNTCDENVGLQGVKGPVSLEEIRHISKGGDLFSMQLSNTSSMPMTSHSYCEVSFFDVTQGEYRPSVVFQDGRKHYALLRNTDRSLVSCPSDEVAPWGDDCRPNPLLRNNSFVHDDENNIFYIIVNGHKQNIAQYFMDMLGARPENFTGIRAADITKVPTGRDYTFNRPGRDLPDGTQLVFDSQVYYMDHGTRCLVPRNLRGALPSKCNAPVSSEYLEAIPVGPELIISMIAYPNGTLLTCHKMVYYMLQGKRRYVNGNVWEALHLSFDNLRRLTCGDLDLIPEEAGLTIDDVIFTSPVQYKTGDFVDGDIIEFNNSHYYFLHGAAMAVPESLVNIVPRKKTSLVGKSYFLQIPLASGQVDIKMINFPDGTLVTCKKSVYYMLNGMKRYIDGETFEALGLSWNNLMHLHCIDLDSLQEGSALQIADVRPTVNATLLDASVAVGESRAVSSSIYPDGTLLMCKRSVYYMLQGSKRYIDGATFEELGLNWGNVKHIKCEELDPITEGPALRVNDVNGSGNP